MLKGCDVSNWQEPMSFKGYDFVMIKASEGLSFVDKVMPQHLNNAKAAGCRYGFYHYARPDYGNSASDEARFFLAQVSPYLPCMLALDWEGDALKYDPSWAVEFLNTVFSETGIRPLFYTSASVAAERKYRQIYEANYGLWVAHWGVNAPSIGQWPFYAMWQYTSKPFDHNYWNGDGSTWDGYATCEYYTLGPGKQDASKNEAIDKIIEYAEGLKD